MMSGLTVYMPHGTQTKLGAQQHFPPSGKPSLNFDSKDSKSLMEYSDYYYRNCPINMQRNRLVGPQKIINYA